MKPTAPFHVQAGRGIVDANRNIVLSGIARRAEGGVERYESEGGVDPGEADIFTREVCDILNRALAPKVRKRKPVDYLPVIFRVWRGEVIALLPTVHESDGGHLISSYAHMGQSGPASCSLTQAGRPATASEYADLLRELQGIYDIGEGCTLKVVRRRPAMR